MVRVKFLQDFRGKLTNEQYYQAGDIAEFDAETAQSLFDERRAEPAEIDEEVTESKPKRTRKAK